MAMGLDWNPMARPKKGAEAELESLLSDLDEVDDAQKEARIARFHEITEAPYETLGAPRVGFDPRADAWLVERLKANGAEDKLAEASEQMQGYYVLDLLPESPGLPVYTSFGYEGVDRYTFRGKFLDLVQDVIGPELYANAWERMSAGELGDYGNALLKVARAYAKEHGLEHLEDQRDPPEDGDDDSPAARAHIIFSAAKWCLWWAERGHGLEPYY